MNNETQSIVVELDLAHPPAKVWRALTDPQLIAAWLMENTFLPVVGHVFTFRAPPMPGWDGVVRCEVLEADAPRYLRYTWCGGAAENALDTTLSFTLTPTTAGTHLRLEHAGFTAKNAFAFDAMGKGWRSGIAKRLQEIIATRA
jgi:uncharacterized protein YndB with AHSA1/START domain